MRVAMHTRLRPDRVADYEAAHREVPAELTAAIRAGGTTSWTIWRSGVELFHLLECDDPAALFTGLESLPAQIAWAARMADLVATYGSLPLGTTDASVIALAERLRLTDVATLDRRHFTVIRPRHALALELLP